MHERWGIEHHVLLIVKSINLIVNPHPFTLRIDVVYFKSGGIIRESELGIKRFFDMTYLTGMPKFVHALCTRFLVPVV